MSGKGDKRSKQGIYAIHLNGTNDYYIGSAVDVPARWRRHRHELRNNRHHSPRLQKSWWKHGEASFDFVLLEIVNEAGDLISREQSYLDRFDPSFNALRVAGSSLGFRHSEASIEKMRGNKNCLGHKQSDEARAATSRARAGMKFSDEHRANLSKSRIGNVHSEVTKAKLSESLKGRGKPPRTDAHRAALSAAAKRYYGEQRKQSSPDQ